MNDRNMFVGNGRLDAVRSEQITFADHGTIRVRAKRDIGVAGEDPSTMITKIDLFVDANGSDTDSKLLVRIKVYRRDYDDAGTGAGTAVAADTYEWSANGTAVTANANSYAATTIGALVKSINKNCPYVEAQITDAPYSLSTDTATWVDTAAGTILTREWTNTCTNDVSASYDVYKRIGLPEPDNRDPIMPLELNGTETGTVTLAIYTDDAEDGAGDTYLSKVMTATQTEYLGFDKTTAPVWRGPLVLSFTSADMSALSQLFTYRNAINI